MFWLYLILLFIIFSFVICRLIWVIYTFTNNRVDYYQNEYKMPKSKKHRKKGPDVRKITFKDDD